MRSNRRERGSTVLLLAALIAVLAGIVLGVVFRKVMVVKSVSVSGVEGDVAANVRSLSGIRLGQSIFDVNERQIAINLREDGYIKLCDVQVIKPDTVVIEVQQRHKVAALEHLGFIYVVDPELSVLECAGGLSGADVMLVSGASIQQTPVGMPLNIDQTDGALLKRLLEAVENAGLCDVLSELNVENHQSIYCVTRSGYVFRLGDSDDMARKLSWIEPMEARLKSEGRISGTIDVSGADAADYIPPRATPAPTTSPADAVSGFQPYDATAAPAQAP